MKPLKSDAVKLGQVVDEILWRVWDPIGINDETNCRDEYQRYVHVVADMLRRGAGEKEIAAYLSKVETTEMGLSGTDNRHTGQAASEICAAYGRLKLF